VGDGGCRSGAAPRSRAGTGADLVAGPDRKRRSSPAATTGSSGAGTWPARSRSAPAPERWRRKASFDDGSRGAEVYRSCALCHSLTPDDGNRAGPTLHGIFGRRIGTAEGYDYSQALRDMDIVWTPETVAELFEVGPDTYTPGSRMPDQRVPAAEDRAALVEFLARVTR
jgi:cytochrome c2